MSNVEQLLYQIKEGIYSLAHLRSQRDDALGGLSFGAQKRVVSGLKTVILEYGRTKRNDAIERGKVYTVSVSVTGDDGLIGGSRNGALQVEWSTGGGKQNVTIDLFWGQTFSLAAEWIRLSASARVVPIPPAGFVVNATIAEGCRGNCRLPRSSFDPRTVNHGADTGFLTLSPYVKEVIVALDDAAPSTNYPVEFSNGAVSYKVNTDGHTPIPILNDAFKMKVFNNTGGTNTEVWISAYLDLG